MKRLHILIALFLLLPIGVSAQLTVKQKRQQIRDYNAGVTSLLEKNYLDAMDYFTNCIELDQSYSAAFLNRGKAYAAMGSIAEAVSDFDQAIFTDPANGEAYFYKAYYIFKEDTTGRAKEYFELALERGFELAEAHYCLGLLELEDGEDDRALIQFNKAINMKDDYALAYHNRAGIKMKLGDYNGALYDYKTAVNYMEFFPLAYNNMGAVKIILGDYAGAIADFTTAIEQNPDFSLAFNNRGYALYQLGGLDTAYLDFKAALELENTFMEAKLNSAAVMAAQSDFDNAIAFLDEVIYENVNNGLLYLNRGLVKEMKGDVLGACEDWHKAQELGEEMAAEYLNECK